jgi:hypothetical protein
LLYIVVGRLSSTAGQTKAINAAKRAPACELGVNWRRISMSRENRARAREFLCGNYHHAFCYKLRGYMHTITLGKACMAKDLDAASNSSVSRLKLNAYLYVYQDQVYKAINSGINSITIVYYIVSYYKSRKD